jgi:hypothetical protein
MALQTQKFLNIVQNMLQACSVAVTSFFDVLPMAAPMPVCCTNYCTTPLSANLGYLGQTPNLRQQLLEEQQTKTSTERAILELRARYQALHSEYKQLQQQVYPALFA